MQPNTTIADLIAAEDKLYFDKKACASAFLKGFILGAFTVCAGSAVLIAGYAFCCLQGFS